MTAPTDLQARMVALRRDLHQQPELSCDEARTAERVASELRTLGLEPLTGQGGHGLWVDLPGDGPLVALRADMDALPVHERTGLSFASRVPGVMHACGHDGHSAALVGAAALLLGRPAVGPVRLLWQPAEEDGSGALAMIEAGVLRGVEAIFGGHIDRLYPAGTLAIQAGAVNASADRFRITVQGRGGHGARPHETVDALVVGAKLVSALQQVVAREVDPGTPAVVSVGAFHSGTASNVIASEALLDGTLRAQSEPVRAALAEAVRRIAEGVASAHRAKVQVQIDRGSPAVVNPVAEAALAARAAQAIGARVVPLVTANMGGEDFGNYLLHRPGCYIRFGAGLPSGDSPPAHSSEFDFDEAALTTAAAWLAEVARQWHAGR